MPTPNLFAPAVKYDLHLRLATIGPAGSGKSFTNLKILALMLGGTALESGGVMLARRANGLARIAVIDTEYGSARKYADLFPSDIPGQACFDVVELQRNNVGAIDPADYMKAIAAARQYEYEGLDIDSGSHAWEGVLDIKNKKDLKGGDSFTNWNSITPIQNTFIKEIISYPGHVAMSMRSKAEYVIEPNPNKPGKNKVTKVGTKPIQREGVDYEFDVVLLMADGGMATVDKTRCNELTDRDFVKPGVELADVLKAWLASPVAAPMTRDEFIDAMNDLGVTDVGAFLAQNELLSIGGADKYRAMLAKSREIVAAAASTAALAPTA